MSTSLMDILRQAGFKGNGLAMAYAICMAESGGRANATNSVGNSHGVDRGLFQINSYYHPEVSDAQAFNALANAKAAYRISHGGTNWNAWSTYHNGAYKQYYGGSSGALITGGSGGGVGTVSANLSLTDMAARFGLTTDVLKHNSDIKKLVQRAIKEGWDGTLFNAYLKNTHWWKTTSDAQRKYFLLRYEDPATYAQKWKQNQFSINQLAVQVGLGNQINGKGQSSGLLSSAITHKMRDGWSDAQIKSYLGQSVGMHGDSMYGEAGENYDQLFTLAYQNGMSFSKDWYLKNVRSIVSGKSTLEDFEGQIRNQAAAKYSAFSNQIHAGQNAMDLAQPYINAVSQILELPQTSIDLTNKYVNKAMTSKQAAGMQPGTQYPLWQFENDLRSDPLWKQTNNARESMFGVAHQVAKDFGLAF